MAKTPDPAERVAIKHPDNPGFVKTVARRSLPARLGAGWVEASDKDVADQPAPGLAEPGDGSELVAIRHKDNPDFVKVVPRRAFAGRAEAGWVEAKSSTAKALVEEASPEATSEEPPAT